MDNPRQVLKIKEEHDAVKGLHKSVVKGVTKGRGGGIDVLTVMW